MFRTAWLTVWAVSIKSALWSRRDANKVASQLLREILSPEQRAQYDSKEYFDVTGGQTGNRYRIRRGSQMNVEELTETGVRVRGLCVVPKGKLPIGDILLAQKLALELMEEEALKVARTGAWLAHN
jgi:hypothetical protein